MVCEQVLNIHSNSDFSRVVEISSCDAGALMYLVFFEAFVN